MNILILNFILSTSVNGQIIRRDTNRDTMIYTMARGFVACGHRVTLLASEEYRPLNSERNEFEVKYFPSFLPKVFRPDLLPCPRGLRKYLKANHSEYDMLLTIETFSIPTLVAAQVCPEKLLIWQEVGVYQKFVFKLPAKFWCHVVARMFMRDIPLVAMSPGAKRFTQKFMDNVRPEVVAHGADATLFYPADDCEDYFIITAMMVKRKRIDTMIVAFADFVHKYPEERTRLKIIGEGPEESNLKELARKSGVAGRIDFLGFMNHADMASIERKAKAFLVNTASDLNMVSVTEAIANGTPVLMNTVAETREYVKAYGCGIVKDGWGAEELREMSASYRMFHENAVKARHHFVNTGVADMLCDSFRSGANRP